MDDKIMDKVAAFDTLFTNNHINKLKILMSYCNSSMQKNIAVYIKYLELQYTMDIFKKHPNLSLSDDPSIDHSSLFHEIMPYCTPSEKSRMENIQQMLRTFEQYKEMMDMVQMMQEMFPEGENPMNGMFSSMDLSQMFSGMDLSQMFEMFQMQGGDDNGNGQ